MTETRHLSVAIDRPFAQVYAFASDPLNLPQWASGLAGGIERAGDHWQIVTPEGRFVLRFAASNQWGVLDHTVVLPGGEVYVPMRVVANGEGSQFEITLFRQPGMDDAAYQRDLGLVNDDLMRLKALLEGRN